VDRVDGDRALVKRVIEDYARLKPSYGDIEVETIFDDARGHYELVYAGWNGRQRVHGSVIHVDIRGGKIWVQHDGTSDGIAEELVRAGVPRDRIVLAFHHPDARRFTQFATG
jgi:XisI protein